MKTAKTPYSSALGATNGFVMASCIALPVLVITTAKLLAHAPRDGQVLFAAVASLTIFLTVAAFLTVSQRRERQWASLIVTTRRLGHMQFAQVPGTALHNFDTHNAIRLGAVYSETAARLARTFGKLQAMVDMDHRLLSISTTEDMVRATLPLIAEVLQSRTVSVVLLDGSASGSATSLDCLLEQSSPIAARTVAINEAQLQAVTLDVHAVGVDAETYFQPFVAGGARAFRLGPIQYSGQVRGFLCVGYQVDMHAMADIDISIVEIAERLSLALSHRAAVTKSPPIRTRSPLETGLHRALRREGFALAYQPIIDANWRQACAVEALIRWPKDKDGISRSAAEFIPVAEDTGLIVELGDWVLRTACAQFNSWRRDGIALDYIAVNVSAHQLRHSGLLASVIACLQRNQMDPEQLQLEITESMLDEGPEPLAMLHELAARGVRVALDDFGDGNSSLSAVRNLPVSVLKIDSACVAGLADNDQVKSLVRALIGMGTATSKQVIAEGVELPQQMRFLEAAGCNAMQGLLFAPAMAAGELTEFMLARPEVHSLVA